MGYLGNGLTITGTQNSKRIVVDATPNQTISTVTGGYLTGQLDVYRNGVKLVDTQDYTASDGASVTFLNAVSEGDELEFVVFENFDVASALSKSGGSLNGDLVVTGIATFNSDVSIGGTLTYEDVTNIDSVGIITARSFVSIADSIVHTGDENTSIRFPAADTFTVETAGSERLRVDSSGNVAIGTATAGGTLHVENSGELNAFFEGSASTLGARILLKNNNNTANAYNDIEGVDAGGQGTSAIRFINVNDGNNEGALAIRTRASGGSMAEKLRITSTGGVHFNNAELIERVSIVANKLSAVPNVSLDNGMVHYYTTNETTTANPNIISSAGINTNMATGDTMSVTILSKPNGAGYFPRISIDGRLAGITTYWSGGSAPSSAESSGVDVNVYQIIKTGSETFDVLANTSNFA